MISVRNLSVSYGRIAALQDASLDVCVGDVTAVVGVNGAGKSSLVRAVLGLEAPTAGHITIDGTDTTVWPSHKPRSIGYVPEGRVLAGALTVAETLRLGAGRVARNHIATRTAGVLARFPELAKRLNQKAGTLSGGEATMLAVSRALMAAPRYLLLDEPTLGLSPAATDRVFGIIAELKQDGLGILLVEQNLHRALAAADQHIVLRHGRIVPAGDITTIENTLLQGATS